MSNHATLSQTENNYCAAVSAFQIKPICLELSQHHVKGNIGTAVATNYFLNTPRGRHLARRMPQPQMLNGRNICTQASTRIDDTRHFKKAPIFHYFPPHQNTKESNR